MKMRIVVCCLLASLAITGTAIAADPQAKSEPKPTFASVLDHQLSGTEKTVVPAAEAMPEDKYNFAPTQGEFKDVRSFAGQVRHLAQANYYFWGSFAGTTPEASAPIEKLTSKADIVKALKDSFALPHKAIDSMTAENAFTMTKGGTLAGMSSFGLAHMMDHYGQMVVYPVS